MKGLLEAVDHKAKWLLYILAPIAIVSIGVGVVGNILTRGAVTAYLRSKGYA